MSSLVRTIEKRMMKRAGWRRKPAVVGFDALLEQPIVRPRIVDADGVIRGVRWPRRVPRAGIAQLLVRTIGPRLFHQAAEGIGA